MKNKVCPAQDCIHQNHHRFETTLGIWNNSIGQRSASAGRNAIKPGQLGYYRKHFDRFRAADGQVTSAQINNARSGAKNNRRSRVDHLGKYYAGEYFRALLNQRTGKGDCRSRSGHGQGGNDYRLAVTGINHQSLQHPRIKLKRAVGIDQRDQGWFFANLVHSTENY